MSNECLQKNVLQKILAAAAVTVVSSPLQQQHAADAAALQIPRGSSLLLQQLVL